MYKDLWRLMVLILENLLDKKNRLLDKQPAAIQKLRRNKKKVIAVWLFAFLLIVNLVAYCAIPGPFFSGVEIFNDGPQHASYHVHSNIPFYSKGFYNISYRKSNGTWTKGTKQELAAVPVVIINWFQKGPVIRAVEAPPVTPEKREALIKRLEKIRRK